MGIKMFLYRHKESDQKTGFIFLKSARNCARLLDNSSGYAEPNRYNGWAVPFCCCEIAYQVVLAVNFVEIFLSSRWPHLGQSSCC